MHIGIIVHSQTGNTWSVAVKLKEELEKAGHSAALERLKVAGDSKPGTPDARFEALPDLTPYDGLVFASHVEGFALPPVMQRYLADMAPLNGKPVAPSADPIFPVPLDGGKADAAADEGALRKEGREGVGRGGRQLVGRAPRAEDPRRRRAAWAGFLIAGSAFADF